MNKYKNLKMTLVIRIWSLIWHWVLGIRNLKYIRTFCGFNSPPARLNDFSRSGGYSHHS
jgi:hypothetical protein